MSKYTYTVWMEYGFTVQSDELLDPEDNGDYERLHWLALERLSKTGLAEIITEASYNDISVEETE